MADDIFLQAITLCIKYRNGMDSPYFFSVSAKKIVTTNSAYIAAYQAEF